jgi:hypothetical protein
MVWRSPRADGRIGARKGNLLIGRRETIERAGLDFADPLA